MRLLTAKTLIALSSAFAAAILSAATPLGASSADKTPAKELFGKVTTPAPLAARSIGFYAKGCLAGATKLAVNGPGWQAMRLSRNRLWGHPRLIALIERLSRDAREYDGWPGLLVGDLSQPRGGPMLNGHASHQIGLDADIWLTQMPSRILTDQEREDLQATSVILDRSHVNPKIWTEAHAKLIKRAASYSEVARIFVHPPIKKALCGWATGNRSWLAKVRPYYGHTYHFHIRMKCPAGDSGCTNQPSPGPGDGTGCGDELSYWLGEKPWAPEAPPKKPPKPKVLRPLLLSNLPSDCRGILKIQ
ncbi:MAG TPA: penicillin-insensitive murein endopeptidase [Aestuariivirgaceae bacterium]|nr:penicillin-insensitive murein endopeptidase [Aestuariivirgaceae bacterium]